MLDVVYPIRPPLDRNTCPCRAIMLAPRVHTMHNMPLLGGVENSALCVCKPAHFFSSHRDGAVQIGPVLPTAIWTRTVEVVCELLI